MATTKRCRVIVGVVVIVGGRGYMDVRYESYNFMIFIYLVYAPPLLQVIIERE
jgi:hypothetical protein